MRQMSDIDWLDTPLEHFWGRVEPADDDDEGRYRHVLYPYSEGKAQHLMVRIAGAVEDAYSELLPDTEEAIERFEATGKVEVIRGSRRGYGPLGSLTLADLPAVLHTLMVLEAEHQERAREASERKAAERKARERVRARERRKLKKLGEW
jgi:hypothetical protein